MKLKQVSGGSELEVSEATFGQKYNETLVHQVVTAYRAAFADRAPVSGSATLATDFASGCGTAFANMSRTLTPQQLTSAERSFGIGTDWKLKLDSFSGSAAPASGEASVAAQATGTRPLPPPISAAISAATRRPVSASRTGGASPASSQNISGRSAGQSARM